jgi:hypothetical protein
MQLKTYSAPEKHSRANSIKQHVTQRVRGSFCCQWCLNRASMQHLLGLITSKALYDSSYKHMHAGSVLLVSYYTTDAVQQHLKRYYCCCSCSSPAAVFLTTTAKTAAADAALAAVAAAAQLHCKNNSVLSVKNGGAASCLKSLYRSHQLTTTTSAALQQHTATARLSERLTHCDVTHCNVTAHTVRTHCYVLCVHCLLHSVSVRSRTPPPTDCFRSCCRDC